MPTLQMRKQRHRKSRLTQGTHNQLGRGAKNQGQLLGSRLLTPPSPAHSSPSPWVGCTPMSWSLPPLLSSFYFLVSPQTNSSGSQLQVTPSPLRGHLIMSEEFVVVILDGGASGIEARGAVNTLQELGQPCTTQADPTLNVHGAEGEQPAARGRWRSLYMEAHAIAPAVELAEITWVHEVHNTAAIWEVQVTFNKERRKTTLCTQTPCFWSLFIY